MIENTPVLGIDGETYDRISGHKEFAKKSDHIPDLVFVGGSVCFECPLGRRLVREVRAMEDRPGFGVSLLLRNSSVS